MFGPLVGNEVGAKKISYYYCPIREEATSSENLEVMKNIRKPKKFSDG